MTPTEKALAVVELTNDPEALKTMIKNARKRGATAVEDAAFRKLISLVPEALPGSIEYDFWVMIHAFEYMLSDERGKTTRLSRTRQKVLRAGVVETLRSWAAGPETDGFKMLQGRGMLELSGEAIVLRHADQFAPDVVEAACKRLIEAGYAPA